MINYKDEDQNALEALGMSPEDCHGMYHAKIREGYLEVLFKIPRDKLFPYLDQFMNLARNPNYDGMIDIKDNGFDRYHFFFKNPEGTKFFDMSPFTLTEGEGQHV